MLAHGLRRWPNIKPTLAQCLVFAGRISGVARAYIFSVNLNSVLNEKKITFARGMQGDWGKSKQSAYGDWHNSTGDSAPGSST